MNGRGRYRPSTGMQLIFGSAYALLVFLPLAVAMMTTSVWNLQDEYGKLTSAMVLIAFSLLSLQPVLAGRLKPLDQQFGLDMVYVFHKTMGMIAALTQVCALAFFMADPAEAVPKPVWVGTVLIITVGVSALLYRELGLTYESWRRLHNMLFALAYLTMFMQTWIIVARMESLTLAWIIVAQAALSTAAYVYHKFLGPAGRRKRLYRVKNITAEARNVWTLKFEPPENTKRFDFLPGQFQFITFDQGRGEEHPFTIVSSPTDARSHSSTIKGSGDFTKTIGSVQPGDLVGIQGAFGRFSHVLEPGERNLVFIAGGIGITPFMSMLRYMRDTKDDRDIVMFYANRSEEDIVFRRELDSIAAMAPPRLRVVHVLDAPGQEWRGEQGRIDRALIKRHANDFSTRLFYLCGPPPMMNALAAMLIDAGVPAQRIRTERFAL
jgi:predicted ferric reductase